MAHRLSILENLKKVSIMGSESCMNRMESMKDSSSKIKSMVPEDLLTPRLMCSTRDCGKMIKKTDRVS